MELNGDITFVPARRLGHHRRSPRYRHIVFRQLPERRASDRRICLPHRENCTVFRYARALLEQIETTTDTLATTGSFQVDGETTAVTTESGHRGVLARYANSISDGVIAALVIEGVGVSVIATGSDNIDPLPLQLLLNRAMPHSGGSHTTSTDTHARRRNLSWWPFCGGALPPPGRWPHMRMTRSSRCTPKSSGNPGRRTGEPDWLHRSPRKPPKGSAFYC